MVKSRSRKVKSSSKSVSQSTEQAVAQPAVAQPAVAQTAVAQTAVAQPVAKTDTKTVTKTGGSKKSVRSFKVKLPETDTYIGRFTGLTPYQAANKALTKYYKENKNKNVSTQVTFTIKESTRGSKKKEYTYNGNRTKLTTPVSYPITDSNGVTKTIVKQFKNTLTKVKLADLPTSTSTEVVATRQRKARGSKVTKVSNKTKTSKASVRKTTRLSKSVSKTTGVKSSRTKKVRAKQTVV